MKLDQRFEEIVAKLEEELEREPDEEDLVIVRRVFDAGVLAGSELEREACLKILEQVGHPETGSECTTCEAMNRIKDQSPMATAAAEGPKPPGACL